ncbi:MAG: hypothetical protein KBA33_08070 [Cloacibacterium sp.]|nr:hypothetical protein [Cloacibacterium sp.]
MPLNKNRLKEKIKNALIFEQTEENSWNDSLERVSEKLATAFVEEILELKVTVPAGIKVSTSGTSAAQTGMTVETKIAELQ